MPRGTRDWKLTPWPICSDVMDDDDDFYPVRYHRTKLYDMYREFELDDALATFGKEPPRNKKHVAFRSCD